MRDDRLSRNTARLTGPPALEIELAEAAQRAAPDVPEDILTRLARHVRRLPLDGSLEARVEWLVDLVGWLREPAVLTLPSSALVSGRSQGARLWLLVAVLERAPRLRTAIAALVGSVLREASALSLFAEVGLPAGRGFLGEAALRLTRPLLPEAPREHQLSYLVEQMFSDPRAARWLDEVPPVLLLQAVELLVRGTDGWRYFRSQIADAIDILSTRVAALGLAEDVRLRSSEGQVRDSPFMRVAEIGMWSAEVLRGTSDIAGTDADAKARLKEVIEACREEVKVVVAHLEKFGVSVDLVYRLERIDRSLARIETLLELMVPSGGGSGAAALHFFSELVHDQLQDRSVLALVRANVRQLARKVIERAGETGEHYITSTREEYRGMLRSAAGGGVLTAGTTVLKFLVATLPLPFFFQGFFASLNYAVSFVLMQLLGYTLATKQPSMTAATLAGALTAAQGRHDFDRLVTAIAQAARSQLAAVIGNIGAVIPAVLIVDGAIWLLTGSPLLSPEKADYTVQSLHPLETGTIFFAALTGVFLWVSSVLAGSIENWAVYRQLPEAIARHRLLKRWIGERGARRAGAFLARNISGIGGNVSLGFLLGMCWTVGSFFGLPIDVRHVTLSTGSLVLAVQALGPAALLTSSVAWAAGGIAIIGALNFGVSFALALFVALRAREVSRRDTLLVARLLLRRLLSDPGPFFLPPRPETETEGETLTTAERDPPPA